MQKKMKSKMPVNWDSIAYHADKKNYLLETIPDPRV